MLIEVAKMAGIACRVAASSNNMMNSGKSATLLSKPVMRSGEL